MKYLLCTAMVIYLFTLQACSKAQIKPVGNIRLAKYPLDNSSAVVTFAFPENFFISIDTVECGLYKIWQGGFSATDSGIIAKGDLYFENYLLNSDIKLIDNTGTGYNPKVKFLGYQIRNECLSVKYKVIDEQNEMILEEALNGEFYDDQYKLTRKFSSYTPITNTFVGIYIPNSSIRKTLKIVSKNGEVAAGIDKLLLPEKDGSTFTLRFTK